MNATKTIGRQSLHLKSANTMWRSKPCSIFWDVHQETSPGRSAGPRRFSAPIAAQNIHGPHHTHPYPARSCSHRTYVRGSFHQNQNQTFLFFCSPGGGSYARLNHQPAQPNLVGDSAPSLPPPRPRLLPLSVHFFHSASSTLLSVAHWALSSEHSCARNARKIAPGNSIGNHGNADGGGLPRARPIRNLSVPT
jgi:hypothetical protein